MRPVSVDEQNSGSKDTQAGTSYGHGPFELYSRCNRGCSVKGRHGFWRFFAASPLLVACSTTLGRARKRGGMGVSPAAGVSPRRRARVRPAGASSAWTISRVIGHMLALNAQGCQTSAQERRRHYHELTDNTVFLGVYPDDAFSECCKHHQNLKYLPSIQVRPAADFHTHRPRRAAL
jgi:hypothetical protein